MANFHQYDYAAMKKIWEVYDGHNTLNNTNFYPRIGKPWLVLILPSPKLRSTSKVVSFDPESGVVVTENSVYVRG